MAIYVLSSWWLVIIFTFLDADWDSFPTVTLCAQSPRATIPSPSPSTSSSSKASNEFSVTSGAGGGATLGPEDLFDFTAIQVILLTLLNLSVPTYHHHRLIRDENGKRLAKRDDARAISTYRNDGRTPSDIRRMVGL